MATSYIDFTGKCKWAKVRSPDEEYQNYKINLYLDKKGLTDLKKTGMKLEPKSDEDGTYVTFRRPVEKTIKGELVKFGPPEIYLLSDGEYQDWPEGLIGNGSNVTIRVSYYPAGKFVGHRLESVGINELVEFEGSGGTPKKPTPPKQKAANVDDEQNDELPF